MDVIQGKDIFQKNEIRRIKEIESQIDQYEIMMKLTRFFLRKETNSVSPPFKGFLLHGLPGTGKTELVKRLVYDLDSIDSTIEYYLYFIDGGQIAAPKWGEAEKNLKQVFQKAQDIQREKGRTARLIILFDDIESLLLGRSVNIAKEWHFSINSIFFHEMDNINPNNCLVFATTNKIDLVDDAIRNRLYPLEIPPPTIEELIEIAESILGSSENKSKVGLMKSIESELRNLKNPTIRDVEQLVIIQAINTGYWS